MTPLLTQNLENCQSSYKVRLLLAGPFRLVFKLALIKEREKGGTAFLKTQYHMNTIQ